ncbi:flagellar basal body L-ring protein FlgH [bacterium]|nr:MAG: flagellar basal body L-ring protein FlgH [bacterium]
MREVRMWQRVREVAAAAFLALAAAVLALPAAGDTLYQPGAQTAPARPLDLFSDHRARAVGDLLTIVFNFSVASNSVSTLSDKKDYALNLGSGVGNLALGPLRFATGTSGNTAADTSQSRVGQQSLNAVMEATVVNVLPSGNLEVKGHQGVVVNGQPQMLDISGVVRPEDIDSTNSVASSKVAGVDAKFEGQFQEPHRGLIRKLLYVLF